MDLQLSSNQNFYNFSINLWRLQMNRGLIKIFNSPSCRQDRKCIGLAESRSPRKMPDASGNNSIRRSLSPRPIQRTKISSIPTVEKVKKMSIITHGKYKIESIQKALEIESKAVKEYQKRRDNKKAYINYQQNLYSPNHLKKNLRSQVPYREEVENNDIKKMCEALFSLRERSVFEELKNRIDKIELNQIKLAQPQRLIQFNQIPPKVHADHNEVFFVEEKQQLSAFDDLDRIVGIKQQNFFFESLKKKELNLFHFMQNPHSTMYRSGWQMLQKIRFTFSSQRSDTTNKHFNQEMDRSLSTFSRILAKNHYSKNVPADFKGDIFHLDLHETLIDGTLLIKLAQGWLNPKPESRKMVQFEQQFQEQRQSATQVVDYWFRENFIHSQINKDGYQKTDMEIYIKGGLTPNEQAQLRKAQLKKQEISSLIKIKADIAKMGIFDKKMHSKLDSKNSNMLVSSIDSIPMTRHTQSANEQPSKFVKDKTTRNKIVIMKQMLQNIKQLNRLVAPIKSRKKTKTNSKNKSLDRSITPRKNKK